MGSEEQTVHYGLEMDAYAHASSPIRRYADLVNQRILKELIMDLSDKDQKQIGDKKENLVHHLNIRGKAMKRFSRDLDFLRAITTGENRFSAIIVEKKCIEGKMKIKMYVPKWKRMVSTWFHYLIDEVLLSRDETRKFSISLYQEVEFECAFMPNGRNWKERSVINILG